MSAARTEVETICSASAIADRAGNLSTAACRGALVRTPQGRPLELGCRPWPPHALVRPSERGRLVLRIRERRRRGQASQNRVRNQPGRCRARPGTHRAGGEPSAGGRSPRRIRMAHRWYPMQPTRQFDQHRCSNLRPQQLDQHRRSILRRRSLRSSRRSLAGPTTCCCASATRRPAPST